MALLRGIEDLVWIQVDGFDPVFSISNEDLERSNEEKTSAVHFMRFELSAPMIEALHQGAGLRMGSRHESYLYETEVPEASRQALIEDLNPAS